MSHHILQINSSLFGQSGVSSQLADELVVGLQAAEPGTEVVRYDFSSDPAPHLSAEVFAAAGTPKPERTAEQSEAAAVADRYIDELLQAKLLVLAVPMYNFHLPSTLKAWFDHVARAGTTFRYTSEGPEGLVKQPKVIIIASRGGAYAGTPNDLQIPYLTQMLGFLGMTEIEVIYAEQLAGENKQQAFNEAREQINSVIAAKAA